MMYVFLNTFHLVDTLVIVWAIAFFGELNGSYVTILVFFDGVAQLQYCQKKKQNKKNTKNETQITRVVEAETKVEVYVLNFSGKQTPRGRFLLLKSTATHRSPMAGCIRLFTLFCKIF
jgi:hypothetical protein